MNSWICSCWFIASSPLLTDMYLVDQVWILFIQEQGYHWNWEPVGILRALDILASTTTAGLLLVSEESQCSKPLHIQGLESWNIWMICPMFLKVFVQKLELSDSEAAVLNHSCGPILVCSCIVGLFLLSNNFSNILVHDNVWFEELSCPCE